MPNRLSIGTGAARGVNAFLQSYMQTKHLDLQEKMQKNAVITELLTRQMADENTSYDDRVKIMRSIPQLYGMKPEAIQPLLQALEQTNDKTVEDPSSPLTPAIPAQKANFEDETPRFAREAVAEGEGGYTGTTRQGELTPNLIKKKFDLEIRRANKAGDFEQAKKIAQVQFDLQEKSYKANGYKITSEGTNAQGEYVQILTNNAGDTKINKLPEGFKPIKLQIAEANINKPSVFIREREDYWESQGFSPEKANEKALADANERFKLSQKGKEAYITGVTQKNAGIEPLSASGRASNEDRDRGVELGIQKDIDDSKAEMLAAKGVMDSLEASKKAAGEAVTVANKELDATELNVGEPGHNALVMRAERARDNYTQIENKYTAASEKETLAKNKFTSAGERMKILAGNSTNGGAIPDQYKPAIKFARDKNPEKTKNLTDQQILNIILSQKKK